MRSIWVGHKVIGSLRRLRCGKEYAFLSTYLAHRQPLPNEADLIMVLGSNDPLVPRAAARLFNNGFADKILVCGGVGRLTGEIQGAEAEYMKNMLIDQDAVPQEAILVEDRSTNTEENIVFGLGVARENGIPHQSVILIQTPILQRRAGLTFRRIAPDIEVTSWAAYIPERLDATAIDLIRGEMRRLLEYGPQGRGFIVDPDIPKNVLAAYQKVLDFRSKSPPPPQS